MSIRTCRGRCEKSECFQ